MHGTAWKGPRPGRSQGGDIHVVSVKCRVRASTRSTASRRLPPEWGWSSCCTDPRRCLDAVQASCDPGATTFPRAPLDAGQPVGAAGGPHVAPHLQGAAWSRGVPEVSDTTKARPVFTGRALIFKGE